MKISSLLLGLSSALCGAAAPPRTPPGLPACANAFVPTAQTPRQVGETLRYVVEMDGLSLGTIDFKVERRGTFEAAPAIEYRSLFKLDALVASVVPVQGRAATLVRDAAYWPFRAMNTYRLDKDSVEERIDFSPDGLSLQGTRTRAGVRKAVARQAPTFLIDFLSGFYLLRRLPATDGCALVYGGDRVYTVHVSPSGDDAVKTPVGLRPARRYNVRYGTDKSNRIIVARLWVGTDEAQLPYRVEVDGAHRLEAHIHLYEAGTATR